MPLLVGEALPFSVGVDIVKVERIRDVVRRRGDQFLQRYFTEREIAYANGKKDPFPHIAARFAAKEAAYKAFSAAGLGSLPLSSFEVEMDDGGVPRLRLTGQALSGSALPELKERSVSLSHDGDYAIAVVGICS